MDSLIVPIFPCFPHLLADVSFYIKGLLFLVSFVSIKYSSAVTKANLTLICIEKSFAF